LAMVAFVGHARLVRFLICTQASGLSCPLRASVLLPAGMGLLGLLGAKLEIEEQPHGQQDQGKNEHADLQPSGELLDPSDRHPYDHSRDDQNHPDGIEGLVLWSLRLGLLECWA